MIIVINKILSILTLVGHIALIFGIAYFFFFRENAADKAISFFNKHSILFSFLIALFATATSLFYSNIAEFAPCELCWFQRIFMYPLIIILGIGWLKKDHKIIDYGLALAVFGGLIALYQNYLSYGGTALFSCAALSGVSCAKQYVMEFGYITIPLMSLTSFVLIIALLCLPKFRAQEEKYGK